MAKSTFQEIILKLQQFWADQGCLIAQPYYTQVGAGTMNPATFLRVLGPEPWNVAYVEPSVRPDDGRYGQNPNRFQLHTQYQVILKPDPGNPQELFLDSLKSLGIDPLKHDIRFVEDNWEQPAISAWGLGWEVWVDGQEITQFTYFQQMGGIPLDPVSVEITYGLERILIALNNADAIWDELWGAGVRYGDIRQREEYEHSKYYFETADIAHVRKMYDLFSAEADACLGAGLVLPAHDYVLKCSHAFNILDTRGAISVAERQAFFKGMRLLARRVAEAYVEQRRHLEFPLLKEAPPREPVQPEFPDAATGPADFVLEIGVEELPVHDVEHAIGLLEHHAPGLLETYNLRPSHGVHVYGTPRRLVLHVGELAARQADSITEAKKGPPEAAAFDASGEPTQAALGWAKAKGVPSTDAAFLKSLVRAFPDGRYLQYKEVKRGESTLRVLADVVLPQLLSEIKFEKSMRWNDSGVAFSRPIRWILAMHGESVVPFEYAGIRSGNLTRGLRPNGSPEIEIPSADRYLEEIGSAGIVLAGPDRRDQIREQVKRAAEFVGAQAFVEEDLIAETADLVEKPTAVLGNFDPRFLDLPRDVLITVMKKQQRYFPIEKDGKLMPNFVAIRNGDDQHLQLVQEGNEHVLGARFADADFFVREDVKQPLEAYLPKLAGLTFHTKLGSMLDKTGRIRKLTSDLIPMLGLGKDEAVQARRAAALCKADLVTKMVTEMTSLQGLIGAEYALRSGESEAVAQALREHYETTPKTRPGLLVALADRLDSLVGLFALGLAPTGAKDPFGLRRAALGIVQPLLDAGLDFDLRKAIQRAAKVQRSRVGAATQQAVLDFMAVRLGVLLKDAGHRYDIVDSVLEEQAGNPAGAGRSVTELRAWVDRSDWRTILPAFARCVRITRDQKKTFTLAAKGLEERPEKDLYRALRKAEAALGAARRRSPDSLFEAFVPMIPMVNGFFDDVLVMAKKKTLRENRLALLQRIASLSRGVADLSRLEGF